MADTEYNLREWRGGQVQAERLAATLLHLEGFSSVDPQCPLGGADGIKDVLCEKNGWKYVAAAYFPTTNKNFSEIKSKFTGDLKGVNKNSASGIVFITNQHLTLVQRKSLEQIAEAEDCNAILYHLERARGILDSPVGYGARLEFLGIGMSPEEQLSFFSQLNSNLDEKLNEQSLLIIRELSRKIDLVSHPVAKQGERVESISQLANRTTSLLTEIVEGSDKASISGSVSVITTNELTIETLCMLHKALMVDMPNSTQAGNLRTQEVWIGRAGASKQEATHQPPPPQKVKEQLDELLQRWSKNYGILLDSEKSKKIEEITRFHHGLLSIHPFLDGNGRLARFLLAQQALELLGIEHKITLEDRRSYFDALQNADNDNYEDLEAQITQALFGVEFIAGSPCGMSGQICPACETGVMDIAEGEAGIKCGNCGLFIPA